MDEKDRCDRCDCSRYPDCDRRHRALYYEGSVTDYTDSEYDSDTMDDVCPRCRVSVGNHQYRHLTYQELTQLQDDDDDTG